MDELVVVENLKKWFLVRAGLFARRKTSYIRAVDGVSFVIRRGEIFCLAGESGCGKTTTGRTILRLEEPTSGEILFDGVNVFALDRTGLKTFRKQAQIIFQDPYESLDSRMTIFDSVAEGLVVNKIGRDRSEKIELVAKALEEVDLTPAEEFIFRYPHELSGGQRQRVAIAAAMILRPKFIVADEPVSMLDMSTRGSIVKLLMDLQKSMQLTFLFITHDLSLMKYISDRIAIMYLGRIVEMGPSEELIDNPHHPYSQALISAVPSPDPEDSRREVKIKGDISSSFEVARGCQFAPRCPYANEKCLELEPEMLEITKNRYLACHKI